MGDESGVMEETKGRSPFDPIDSQWSQTSQMARRGKGHTMAKHISFFV
jgi:hypothetical protein